MGKTTKSDIIEALSKECNISAGETWKIVETMLQAMSDALSRGESIELRGFGTFKIKQHGLTGNRNMSCERDVTITSDVVKLDGCHDTNISLFFDPNDQEYPFKGKSPKVNYKLKAK